MTPVPHVALPPSTTGGAVTVTARDPGRAELGDFLRRRREALRPADVGLPTGTRRRTPGLRRDEVAMMANMSPEYYERLEQARGPQPSASMLASIAAALRLTTDERAHLFLLARQAPPASIEATAAPDPGLMYVLYALAPTTPAFVADDLGTVLAQNPLNVAIFGSFAQLPGREANLVWRWFTDPRWRSLLGPADHEEEAGRAYVADLRAVLAQRGHDADATALVADLQVASPQFARMWAEHQVSTLECLVKEVPDARVGRLDLECVVVLSPLSRQRLLLLQPLSGTDTSTRLARLGALIAQEADGSPLT